ncbi:hypothetical protein Tco_0846669 [Tanacetum coccineum]
MKLSLALRLRIARVDVNHISRNLTGIQFPTKNNSKIYPWSTLFLYEFDIEHRLCWYGNAVTGLLEDGYGLPMSHNNSRFSLDSEHNNIVAFSIAGLLAVRHTQDEQSFSFQSEQLVPMSSSNINSSF